MKKQTFIALGLTLLIPVVWIAGGWLFSLINPEIAAGHPNYARNFHLLHLAKNMMVWGAAAIVAVLWFLACFLVIRSKQRSLLWMFAALFGPFGFAILSALDDKAPAETDRYAKFVRGLNKFTRAGYEACVFVIVWLLAHQGMLLLRNAIILYQSATTGMSTAQIIDLQNASSGMWAFAEGNEEMYFVILLYLLWPIAFNVAARFRPLASSQSAPSISANPSARA
jgi:hypothetical protein